jgi:hypothetical protein
MVSTWNRSQAGIAWAWAGRNWVQLGPLRQGEGSIPAVSGNLVKCDRRGATPSGQQAPVPDSSYEPLPPVAWTDTGLDVPFVGEDGRRTVFRVCRLPLPGWHAPLTEAFAERVGPTSTRRPLSSAAGSWTTLGRFLRFLDGLPQPPLTPRELTAAQVDAYLRHRVRSPLGQWAWEELIELRPRYDCRWGALTALEPIGTGAVVPTPDHHSFTNQERHSF